MATLAWRVTFESGELMETNSDLLMSNGVSWEPNPSTGSRNITITLDSMLGYRVTGIKCIITRSGGPGIQQCSICINIHIYGK